MASKNWVGYISTYVCLRFRYNFIEFRLELTNETFPVQTEVFPETRYSTALERFLKRVPLSIIIESRDLLVFPNLNISFVIFLVQHESFRVHFFHPSNTMSCALFSFQNLYLNQIKIALLMDVGCCNRVASAFEIGDKILF